MELLRSVPAAPAAPSPAARARSLMSQARAAAFEQTRDVDRLLREAIVRAQEIAEGGDAYPASVRDLCARLADETEKRRQLLEVLAIRGLDPPGRPVFGFADLA